MTKKESQAANTRLEPTKKCKVQRAGQVQPSREECSRPRPFSSCSVLPCRNDQMRGASRCGMCVQSVMLVCIGREQSMFRVQPERKGIRREAAQKTKKAKTSCDTHRPSVRKQNAALWSFAQQAQTNRPRLATMLATLWAPLYPTTPPGSRPALQRRNCS